PRRAETRARAHGRRAADGGLVHLAQEPEAESLDEAALLLLHRRIAHAGLEALARRPERRVQRDRIREADVHRAVPALEDAARAQECAERLRLLLLARDFAAVDLFFGNAPVVDGDRHEVEVAPDAADERVQDRRQHAEPRREHLPGPRSSAFDEELLRVALADQEGEVLPED